jgi:putative ABC transport system permease protein
LSALTNDAQLIYGQYPKPVLTSMSSELGSIYLFLMLPIICCGFILIYNCFILSLAQDRRDYAGLRCIGATKKQIKLLIVVQGLITGCLGVIIATIICFPIIQFCVPQIIEVLNVRTKHLIVSWYLFAFIMTYLVVTIIVILGCMLAYKNNNMSPITAKNYYEHRVKDIDRVTKKTNKKRLQKLFTYNFRDIIKTIFPSVLILIFGIVIFIIIDTVVLSMDTEKFENMYLSSYDMIYYYEESVQDIDSQTYSATNSFSDMYIDRIKDIVGSNNISIISEVNLKMKYDKKLLDKQLNYYAKTNKTSVQIDEYLDSKVIILDNIYIKFAMENNTYDVDWDRFGKGDFVLLGTDHSELFQSSMKLSGTIDGNDNEIYFNVEDFIPLYCENNEESACPYIYASETFMKKYDSAQIKKRRINIAIDNKNSDIKNELPSLGVQNQNVQIIDRVNLKNVIDSGRVLLKTGGYTYAILILIVGSISFVNTMILVASSRKKEFIIFRCIGMRVQQLYSLIIYESIKYSIIIGTTILLIGHIALFVTYKLFKNITGYAVFHYPVESILITIIGITVILILTPIVIIKKIRVDCISDILRR